MIPRHVALLVAALVVPLGCRTTGRASPADRPESPTADDRTRPSAHARRLDDDDIANAVRRELAHDPSIVLDGIDVSVELGIVELTGHVTHLLARERAGRKAELTRGVRAVSNRLVVQTPTRPDDPLEDGIRHALSLDPNTHDLGIAATVTDQVATLTGVVGSRAEAAMAERVVRAVRGLKDVRSDLSIDHGIERPDHEIARDIQARLRWDSLVDQQGIEVTVEDAAVVLGGAVGSAAEKRRAEELAWVDGTRTLAAGDLVVRPWLRDQLARDPIAPTDEQIEDAFRLAAMFDPRVAAHRVEPHAAGLILRLEGVVPSLAAKRAAEQLGRNTVGVLEVDNRLVVAPRAVADAELQRDALWALDANPITDVDEIEVVVDHARATARGAVDTRAEITEAIDVIGRIDGIRSVNNELVVEGTRTAFYCDPFSQPYCPYTNSWEVYPGVRPRIPDAELETRIMLELAWSPWIREGEVEVSAEGGVVTLSGEVAGARARNAAILNALEGGAIGIVDQLEVVWP